MPTVVDIPSRSPQSQPRSLPPWLERLETILENLFRVGRFRFGLDSLVGLVPGGGDWATALVGSLIILAGAWQGLPKVVLIRMVWNLTVDLTVGAVPVIGDALDFVYRSNRMNLAMYREALAGTRNLRRDYWFVGGLAVLLLGLMALSVWLVVKLWSFLTQWP